ncbi:MULTISPECIES: FAD-dependent oxidoreductase [unclassified Rhodococcus (in: high G+C Gram-positive bacteria)]|uniref:NAD(P)/FAD-dependent oxidoreductase n=1 Tax=unclassified Rhodococcus (in: high G+C Gram-positive bacteria) TaxID=192944 RepID=UPI00163A06A0|nr:MULTISPECIES: FAD-dependent oxidoreductase [unclassified Rhodococcus (in: high G+C Gram-positive bacteria)]MBC2640096.1 FAD-dependent oxidoreductase [Rhodococcus sp. 3A]MBC2895158.1 FAD-dependent oxidoreductase [Rhodococcus sp. 4CII]
MSAVPNPSTELSTVVIVGSGIAGASAAQTLRSEGFRGRVVLIGDEPSPPYRRPAVSKDLLSGATAAEKAALKPGSFWNEQDIELITGATAVGLDTRTRRLTLASGETLHYSALLLATGGRARRLDGVSGAHVFTLRSMRDAESLRASIRRTGSLLVIGGGLIGCEVAATARSLGAEVTVLERDPSLLGRIVPPEVSARIATLHRENGVDVCTDVALSSLEVRDGSARALADDGRCWSAGTVLVSVGTVPEVTLAAAAGLRVHNGITVDGQFRTSADGVYAAGDAANIPGVRGGDRYRSEHWNGAQAQGIAAARSILGTPQPFTDVPWGWSTQYGHNVQFAGATRFDDDYVVRGSIADRDFTAIAVRKDVPVGVIAVGRPKDLRTVRTLIARGRKVDRAALADESVALTDVPAGEREGLKTPAR